VKTFVRTGLVLLLATVVTLVMSPIVAGQNQPSAPVSQRGHPSGKLILGGDVASFDNPAGLPTHCVLTNRFKRGQRMGFRMRAIDGGTGEIENTAVLVAHVTHAGRTVDVPMRWRGNVPFPKEEYSRAPVDMWTGVWTVASDAPIGIVSYTITATDRFGRAATFIPFPNLVSQIAVVE
jgi:hypothetical protein